jgi:transcriptional regulator with XRE-family HTH domain
MGSRLERLRLPEDFWSRADVYEALAGRDLGALFRLVGKWAGASQTQIAIVVGMTQGQVSQIMAGKRQVVVLDVAERVLDGLAVPDSARLVFGLAPSQFTKGQEFEARPVVGYERALFALSSRVETSTEERPIDGESDVGSDGYSAVLRRDLFRASAAGAVASLFEVQPTRVTAAIDPAIVNHFSALRALLVDSDNRLGAVYILPTVHQQLGLIAEFRRQARGNLHDQLLRAEARWAEFAGWLSDDLGDQAAGTRWLSQAMTMAQEANDSDFSAYLFARMAQRATNGADEDRVLGLAQAASRANSVSPYVQAFAAVQRAHGHSLAGEVFLFQSAFDEARQLIDGSVVQDGDLGSFCTPPYLMAQEGEGWLRLNRPRAASASFARALAIWPEAYRRDRGVYLSRAATAQLASGRPDEAAATALEALKLADVTQSTRIRRQVATVSRHIGELGPSSAVDSLRAALSEK